MNDSEREAIAFACAKEKDDSWDREAAMPMFLRRVPVDESHPAPWEIDLPSLGTTVYGELPEIVFEEALKVIAQHGNDLERDVNTVAAELEKDEDPELEEDRKQARISGTSLVHAKKLVRLFARELDDAEKRGYERGFDAGQAGPHETTTGTCPKCRQFGVVMDHQCGPKEARAAYDHLLKLVGAKGTLPEEIPRLQEKMKAVFEAMSPEDQAFMRKPLR